MQHVPADNITAFIFEGPVAHARQNGVLLPVVAFERLHQRGFRQDINMPIN
jgi:hypothetical protein